MLFWRTFVLKENNNKKKDDDICISLELYLYITYMHRDKDVNVAHVRFFEIFFAQILLDSACVTLDFFRKTNESILYKRRRKS